MKILEINQKLITSGSKLREIKDIGRKIENSVSSFFLKSKQKMIQLKISNGIIFWLIMIKSLMLGVCQEEK